MLILMMNACDLLPREKGSYVLVMKIPRSINIQYGQKNNPLSMKKGWCYYVGSAFNSGGFAARVGRHIEMDKPKRWHIDYLRPFIEMKEVWLLPNEVAECKMASIFKGRVEQPVAFGASDCSCYSHLFYSRLKLRFQYIKKNCEGLGKIRRVVIPDELGLQSFS